MGFIATPRCLLLSSIIHVAGTHLRTRGALTAKFSRRKTNDRRRVSEPMLTAVVSRIHYQSGANSTVKLKLPVRIGAIKA